MQLLASHKTNIDIGPTSTKVDSKKRAIDKDDHDDATATEDNGQKNIQEKKDPKQMKGPPVRCQ